MGNLVKPEGKPKNRQSFQNEILELSTDSPTNLILKTLPIFKLLWIWYSVELRLITKHYPNSFRETNLHQILQTREITHLTICGAMTHMCIDTTVRAAFDLGYNITLIGNACATKDLIHNGKKVDAKEVQTSFLAALNGTFCEVLDIDNY